MDATLRLYDRDSGIDRIIDADAAAAAGRLSWSPDATEIAIAYVEEEAARLDVIALATNSVTRAFGADAMPSGLEVVTWSGPHEIGLRLRAVTGLVHCCGVIQGGLRYTVSDRGGNLRQTGESNPLWRLCGPPCGLPPPGYEAADGSVEWCLPPESQCAVGIVDRTAGVVRQLPDEGQLADYAVSPDRSLVALMLRDLRNRQRLRIVHLRDFTWQDYDLPYVYEGHAIRWFPDGRALVLYFPGI